MLISPFTVRRRWRFPMIPLNTPLIHTGLYLGFRHKLKISSSPSEMIKDRNHHVTVTKELFIEKKAHGWLPASAARQCVLSPSPWYMLKPTCCGDAGRGWCLLYFSGNSSLITSSMLWLKNCFKDHLLPGSLVSRSGERSCTHQTQTTQSVTRISISFTGWCWPLIFLP